MQHNIKKMSNPRAEDLNRYFSKEDTEMDNKHMKSSTSLICIFKEIQIKTIMRHHSTLIRKSIFKNLQTINTGEDVEKRECYHTVGGNVKIGTATMENSMEIS